MENDFYKENPMLLEDWEDLKLWKKSSDNIFNQAIVQYLESKMSKVTQQFVLDCLVDKKYSEVSLVPGSYNIEFNYKVSGLFVNMDEKFFILEKNNEFYAIDVSQEYEYIR
jgi:hypothetical protein